VTLGEANVGQMTLGVAVGEAALFRQLDGSLYWRATVIDASNPAAPTVAYRGARVHQTRTPLARSGSDVWVSLGVNEGERWDLSDPANPVVTVLDEPILSAAPDEGGLWFNVPAGLRRWDVSTSPPVQTDLILVHERPVGRVGDLLAYRNEDLRWLDLARRPERLALSTLPFPDGTYYMEAAGTALYASQTGNDTTESLHVWDISDATAPVKTDTLAAPGSWHLTVGGGVALLNGASGLGVYDLADPLHPVLATTWLDNVGAQHAASALAGPLAATIENSDYEAVFVDFSDPYAPVRRGSVPLDVGYMIGFDGTRAWVGDGGTAQVVDFTDPDAPLTTWSDSLDPWVGWSMVIPRGDLVYAACDSNVSVIDASDPAAPTPLDLAPDWRSSDLGTGYCWDFDVDEATGLLWMPDSDFGLVAWDVSDPTFIHPAVGLPPIGDQESLEIADDGVVWVGSRTHLGAYAQPILPVLDLDLPSDEIAVGTAIDATFTWADLEDAPTNRVSCEVSAGACEVVSVDHAANSAQIAWTPAETVGIHELRVVLSDVDWFLSDSARVRAVP
jgi:hypothetical protein